MASTPRVGSNSKFKSVVSLQICQGRVQQPGDLNVPKTSLNRHHGCRFQCQREESIYCTCCKEWHNHGNFGEFFTFHFIIHALLHPVTINLLRPPTTVQYTHCLTFVMAQKETGLELFHVVKTLLLGSKVISGAVVRSVSNKVIVNEDKTVLIETAPDTENKEGKHDNNIRREVCCYYRKCIFVLYWVRFYISQHM